jgi:hypothetical protein
MKLWMPSLTFTNTELSLGTTVDDKSEIVVERQGKGYDNYITDITENLIFTGAENLIVMSRYYALAFECDFNISI